MAELGWAPTTMFADGIKLTIQWYKDHEDWMRECTSGEYMKYYEMMYGER
jgi:dTDP-glucose 4,6-dehydratase